MAKGKANREKPSRKRYEEEHPTVSFRLKSKGSYKRLHEYLEATASSLSDLVEQALNKLPIKMLDTAKIKQETYEKGKDDGLDFGFEQGYIECWNGTPFPEIVPESADTKVVRVKRKRR